MLVQVIVIVENITVRLQGGIPPSPSGFLHIILQGAGDIIMDHQPDILLIHPHAKGGGGHHDLDLIAEEGLLVGDLVPGIHLPVEGSGRKSIPRQPGRQPPGSLGARHVDDGRTGLLGDQAAKGGIFLLLRLLVKDGIMQVFPGGIGSKKDKFLIQLPLEIVTDITDDLLLSRGSKARNRNKLPVPFLLLQLPDKIPDIEIIHPKVLAPGREAMSLVDDKSNNIAGQEQLFYGSGPQLLRGNIEKGCRPICHTFQGIGPFNGIQQAIHRHRPVDPQNIEIVHLVLHKGLQGRNHHRQPLNRPSRHQSRKLEGDGFSAPRGKYRQQRPALHRCLSRPLLQGLPMIGAKALITKDILQSLVDVQGIPAIGAAPGAGSAPQIFDHIPNPGIILQQPGRGERKVVIGSEQGKGISQLHRGALDQGEKIRIGAKPTCIFLPDKADQVPSDAPDLIPCHMDSAGARSNIGEEALKLRMLIQEIAKDLPLPGGQGKVSIHLIIEKGCRLPAVIDRIIDLIDLQFVLL